MLLILQLLLFIVVLFSWLGEAVLFLGDFESTNALLMFQDDDEDLGEVPPGSPPRLSSIIHQENFPSCLSSEVSTPSNGHEGCLHRIHYNTHFGIDSG